MLTTDNLQNLADLNSHCENVDYLDVKIEVALLVIKLLIWINPNSLHMSFLQNLWAPVVEKVANNEALSERM